MSPPENPWLTTFQTVNEWNEPETWTVRYRRLTTREYLQVLDRFTDEDTKTWTIRRSVEEDLRACQLLVVEVDPPEDHDHIEGVTDHDLLPESMISEVIINHPQFRRIPIPPPTIVSDPPNRDNARGNGETTPTS